MPPPLLAACLAHIHTQDPANFLPDNWHEHSPLHSLAWSPGSREHTGSFVWGINWIFSLYVLPFTPQTQSAMKQLDFGVHRKMAWHEGTPPQAWTSPSLVYYKKFYLLRICPPVWFFKMPSRGGGISCFPFPTILYPPYFLISFLYLVAATFFNLLLGLFFSKFEENSVPYPGQSICLFHLLSF